MHVPEDQEKSQRTSRRHRQSPEHVDRRNDSQVVHFLSEVAGKVQLCQEAVPPHACTEVEACIREAAVRLQDYHVHGFGSKAVGPLRSNFL